LLRFLGARYIMLGLEQSLTKGDTVFYFHPIDISSKKFPSGFSSKRPFYWAIKGKVIEKRIKHLLGKLASGDTTCKTIYSHFS